MPLSSWFQNKLGNHSQFLRALLQNKLAYDSVDILKPLTHKCTNVQSSTMLKHPHTHTFQWPSIYSQVHSGSSSTTQFYQLPKLRVEMTRVSCWRNFYETACSNIASSWFFKWHPLRPITLARVDPEICRMGALGTWRQAELNLGLPNLKLWPSMCSIWNLVFVWSIPKTHRDIKIA